MRSITVSAPAKANLALGVTGRRPDGYHLLKMLVQAVDLCDTVTVSDGGAVSGTTAPGDIAITSDHPGIPLGPGNSAYKAASAILAHAGIGGRVGIHLEKSIPVSSGLGGESADAAGVLVAINALFGLGLPIDELARIGFPLGADIPFCLAGGLALVEGVGERVTPVAGGFSGIEILLARPFGSITTVEVYKRFSTIPIPGDFPMPDTESILQGLREGATLRGEWFQNSLEAVTANEIPEVAGLREDMMRAGATAAVMTGHGPAVAGLFTHRDQGIRGFLHSRYDRLWTAWARPVRTGPVIVGRGSECSHP